MVHFLRAGTYHLCHFYKRIMTTFMAVTIIDVLVSQVVEESYLRLCYSQGCVTIWKIMIYIINFRQDLDQGYRSTDHIFTIKTILNKYINKCKKQVYAHFVDFSKAFDTVRRLGLFRKILNLGIGGKFMYSSLRFVVRKHNTVSNARISRQGARQGDGLSPILFNVFVNDINEIFDINNSDPICLESTKLNCQIYADDVLLISESKKGLQSYLDSLATYCECWKL